VINFQVRKGTLSPPDFNDSDLGIHNCETCAVGLSNEYFGSAHSNSGAESEERAGTLSLPDLKNLSAIKNEAQLRS